jgi:imidazolonepropionase-like amidohydrolase
MRTITHCTVALAALMFSAVATDAQTIAITGGKVHPVSGPVIENGTVLVRDGRIVAVGANVAIPADAQRIDATGKWVTPGFVHGYSGLGVHEIGLMPNTVDRRAAGHNAVSTFPVWEGINPQSVHIPSARNFGVTTAAVVPIGGLISGQAAVIDLLHNRSATDMLIKAPAAIAAEVGDSPGAASAARGEHIARLREILTDVQVYARRRGDYERGNTRDFAARRADLEAMIPLIEGRIPFYVAADRASDIEAAVRIAKDFGLKLVITGGAEAWQVARPLAAARATVLVGASNNIPVSFDALGKRRENAALLRAAGVRVGIIGDPGTVDPSTYNAGNIRFEAGLAVVGGLSWADALRAVTLSPAEALNIDDRVGSLSPGRSANIVIWTGDPFEFSSRAEAVFIRGERIVQPSRRDELMYRYRDVSPGALIR